MKLMLCLFALRFEYVNNYSRVLLLFFFFFFFFLMPNALAHLVMPAFFQIPDVPEDLI